ncbi:ABC transporter, putative [Pediculus humanus corporis]|uniref:ABC transporter, putative n=1 Tax=Pediculus humanus subsp. corporis TaxID=121224 RepID=E0VAP1_PEDHC|nr:ABC transporter, putative [Pediculus humanus corporis]EEB10447.1 ABC transporter, putative [Pediculus humanus corporis]
MNLEFSDVIYKVKRRWRDKESRTILHGVSGSFRAGQLSAILGPSGAGKSTLLNILSGFSMEGVKGEFKVNGQPLNKKLFHKSSRYITQEDLLPPFLTTKEAMLIAANLKLPKTTTLKQREMVVEEILSMLGLFECSDTRTEKLSGGQKKRLSIALELINNPSFFFLDEPTSGLDNVSTMQSLKLLRKLAKQGRTIVCTIHQPSASIFELFDNVYFLAAGKCIYQGTTQQLLPFLSSKGFLCPTYHNPADFVMDIVDTDENSIKIMSEAISNGKICHFNLDHVTDQIKQYNSNETNDAAVEDALMKSTPEQNKIEKVYEWIANEKTSTEYKNSHCCDTQDYPRNSWDQFSILMKRMLKQRSRNTESMKILLLHHIFCGLMVGAVFYNTANDGYQMFNHLKFCVGYILFHTYTNVMLPVLVYPAEVKLLKKEYFNRWYGLNPYYFALMLTKLPLQIIFGTLYATIIYFMAGLPAQLFRFSLFSVIGILIVLVSDGVGMAIGSIFNVTNGSAVGPAVVAPFLGLAVYGFDFARDIPWFIYGIMKLSFMRCGVIATALALFGFGRKTFECNAMYCHFKKPDLILHFLNVESVSIWNEIFTLCVLFVFFRLLNYFALRSRLVVK